ncbi:MAG: S-adenosylmethionine decarboxylase [Deltaproteobacteria bacterium]|nr:S-adenosylmethionine decarboxylase [Deltaproteobacteria bacterium]
MKTILKEKMEMMDRERPETLFGCELILDLYECDRRLISSDKSIQKFARDLCAVIEMKPYGEPLTPYFGENQEHTKGYSLIQFIETSSITGHFSEKTGSAYINIFSCKEYDVDTAENFTKKFFKAKRVNSRFIIRN